VKFSQPFVVFWGVNMVSSFMKVLQFFKIFYGVVISDYATSK